MSDLVPAFLEADVQRGRRFPDFRLIGLELRVKDKYTGHVEELVMLPLSIRLPRGLPGPRWSFPSTLHTSEGDLNMDLINGRLL